jgi:hypothetical protein
VEEKEKGKKLKDTNLKKEGKEKGIKRNKI